MKTLIKSILFCIVCVSLFIASGCSKRNEDSNGISSGVPAYLDIKDGEAFYYYYAYLNMDGTCEKRSIRLNTRYISLSLKEPQLPADIAQRGFTASEFQGDNFGNYQYKGKSGTNRYWTELTIGKDLTPEQYFNLLADVKQKNSNVIAGPYFNTLDGKKMGGTGHFFLVMLKNEGDEALLDQMVEKTGCTVVGAFISPLLYWVSLTKETEFNAMECANIFYESGLFQSADMPFMMHSDESLAY